jgi:hypothetical protein
MTMDGTYSRNCLVAGDGQYDGPLVEGTIELI